MFMNDWIVQFRIIFYQESKENNWGKIVTIICIFFFCLVFQLLHSVDEILLLNIDVSFAATSFALSDLAKFPDIQEKLYHEVNDNLQGEDPSTFQDLDKRLPYMEMVLKESARMHPALALSLPERTVKPVTDLAGYQIPKGVSGWFCL